ncbi:hypothetical protein ACEPAF_546 [Sanghuangporus sanghuang]
MKLFSGPACFSPSIPVAVKDIWIAHGGSVAVVLKEKQLSQWIFCNGIGDPWLARYSVRPVVVFHANWVLASAASGFPLPLAKYVLDDERYAGLNSQNIPSQRNQGSCHAGMSRGASEINPGIEDPAYDCLNSLYTRLTPTAEGNNPRLRKRPYAYEASPEHRTSTAYDARVIKKRKSTRSSEVFQGPASELGPSDSEGTPRIHTSGRLALRYSTAMSNVVHTSATSISFSSPGNTPVLPMQQSDIKENSEYDSEFWSMNKTDHDSPLLCEKLFDKGQVRNNMGFFAESLRSVVGSPSQLSLEIPIGPVGTPDSSCAGQTGDIWSSLTQENASSMTVGGSDIDKVPLIRVSDALVALRRLNAKVPFDHNDSDVTLFVKGRIYCGRKFGVDKDDRRKTI